MLKVILNNVQALLKKGDASFLSFNLSIILLPLSVNLSSFAFVCALVLHLIQVLLKKNKVYATRALKISGLIGLVFFGYILINSIIQTSLGYTIQNFEKSYSHFALLFLTPILMRRQSENKMVLHSLFSGTLIAVIYVFFYSIIKNIQFNQSAFLSILDIHHTYFSMYLLTIVNFCIFHLVTKRRFNSTKRNLVFLIMILVAIATLYFLDSKTSMLILLVLFLIHTLPALNKTNVIGYAFFLIILLSLISVFNEKLTVSYDSALDFRFKIWEASFDTFEKSPYFGNLKLTEKDLLNYQHYLNGDYYFLDSDLNSHNQFLSFLMKFGLLGSFILLLFVLNIFRKITVRTNKDSIKEFLGFAAIMFIAFYIENILDRHNGIVYITVFYNYYLINLENAKS